MNLENFNGTRWRDSNGHEFVVTEVTYDYELHGERYYALFGRREPGDTCNVDTCGPWWSRVHHNVDGEFDDYHSGPCGWGTEREINRGLIHGWKRVTE